jgi:hypothetical protein
MAGDMAQIVECLPKKQKVLSSNSRIAKIKLQQISLFSLQPYCDLCSIFFDQYNKVIVPFRKQERKVSQEWYPRTVPATAPTTAVCSGGIYKNRLLLLERPKDSL